MICQGFGGNLAEIETAKENSFLANEVQLLKGKNNTYLTEVYVTFSSPVFMQPLI